MSVRPRPPHRHWEKWDWRRGSEGKDTRQLVHSNYNLNLIRNVLLDLYKKGQKRVLTGDVKKYIDEKIEELKKLKEEGIYKGTVPPTLSQSKAIRKHMKDLASRGEVKQRGKWYEINPEEIKSYLFKTKEIEEVIKKVKEGNLLGIVQTSNFGEVIFYQFAQNPKIKNKWKGLNENLLQIISRAFTNTVYNSSLTMKEMPDKVLFAFIITPKKFGKPWKPEFKKKFVKRSYF
jgi:hypothetical protein|uniref:Uncharacterized protein n=1 Tax=Dictyoglomus turgidum TaxID=513050 RepID=A0A7C3SN02_9BACT